MSLKQFLKLNSPDLAASEPEKKMEPSPDFGMSMDDPIP